MSAEPHDSHVSSIPAHVRQPTDRLRAESTRRGLDEPVEVQLADRVVAVIPLRQWRSSAIHALRVGDFQTWANKSLTEETRHVWDDVDPSLDEIEALFAEWSTLTGQSPPESFASPR